MRLDALAAGALLGLSLCLDLGLVNVATLRTALVRGAGAGVALGLGSAAGDLVYFTLSLTGAAALWAWPPFRWVAWIGGTAALLFLAARMVREALEPHAISLEPSGADARAGLGRLFATGATLALASPSAIVWFAAVGGAAIAAFGGNRSQLVPFALGFFSATTLWTIALATLASRLRRFGTSFVRGLSIVSALLFLYLAFALAVGGFGEVVGAGQT